MDKTTYINIYTDGGSRGNPGESALGVYVEDERGDTLAEIGKTLGIRTNNFAEYSAIAEALSWVLENKHQLLSLNKINMFMDSQLAVSQLNGVYKVKSASLREILFSIRQKEAEIGLRITYSHVRREYNKKADKLVNLALDGVLD